MTAASWLALLGAGAGLSLFAFWIYRAREVRVAGRGFLGTLRSLTLVTVLLLLLNPRLPWGGAGSDPGSWVIVDGSLSMAAATDGGTPWARALGLLGGFGPAGRVVVMAPGPRALDPDSLAGLSPEAVRSLLRPALALAAEAGATSITVVSDFRVTDLDEALLVAGDLGISMAYVAVGEGVANAGIAEFLMPAEADQAEALEAEVAVFGEGIAPSDSVTVEIRQEGRLVGSARTSVPPPGGVRRVTVPLPPPGEEGVAVRYTATVMAALDQFPEDDERVAYVRTGDQVGGLLIASFAPDWELRFLAPVLAQVTGLTSRTALRVGPDRYRLNRVGGRSVEINGDELAAHMRNAEVLVLHGVDAASPPWLQTVADRAGRLLIVSPSPEAAALVGVRAGRSQPGEWYASSEIPASPLANDLAGSETAGLAPLPGLLPVDEVHGSVPLTLQLRGAGAGQPALLLANEGGRRSVLALASGFWRWGFRDGPSKELYRRLWAGVGGWLLQGQVVAGGDGIRPQHRVNERGEPIEWATGGLDSTDVALRVTLDEQAILDTTLTVLSNQGFRTAPLPPGTYLYEAMGLEDGISLGAGRFDVERFSPELTVPAGSAEDVERDTPGAALRAGPGRALRTHPLPYLLLLGMLAIEWIGRRRQGLR